MPGQISRENGKKGGRPLGSKANHTIQAEAIKAHLIEQVILEKDAIVKALIKQAKAGNLNAIKEILDRTLGKLKDVERVEFPFVVNLDKTREKYS